MGDFIPGYVTTFCDPNFNKLKASIIVVGQDDGKVYGQFTSKSEFFEKMAMRKRYTSMMCYYRNVEFSKYELEQVWDRFVYPVNEKEKNHIADTWKKTLSRFI